MKEQKRVYLVNPPADIIVLRDMYSSTISKGLYNWPPADLLVTSGNIKAHCDIRLKDANTEGLTHEQAIRDIVEFHPDMVFFTFGNSVRDNDFEFIKNLKKRLPSTKVVGSGGILLYNGEKEMNEHEYLDGVCLNFITKDTLSYINEDFENLHNYICRQDGTISKFPLKSHENDFSYDIPFHNHLPLEKYNLSHGKYNPITSVIASFGCPGRCTFCITENIPYKYRNVDNTIEELITVKKLGIREIFFRDQAFGSYRKKTIELLEKMIKSDLTFSWVADSRIDNLDDQVLELMSASGCHALHLGVESANEEILKIYNKKITPDDIEKVFKLCKKHHIRTVGYFILGLPGETKEDVLKTIDFAIKLDADYASFNYPIPIMGTSLRKEAESKGWISKNSELTYDGSLSNVIETEKLSRSEILNLGKIAKRKFYMRFFYLLKRIFSIRSTKELITSIKESILILKG
jgi:anaerobic magnesium-protoporphyrin IX monomethyl ester cyclase